MSDQTRPLRILYDHAIFARQAYGGISRYFAELAPRIAAQDDVSVLMFMGLHINNYRLERYRQRFARFFGIRRPIARKTYRLTAPLNALLFRQFARMAAPDILHETAYLSLPVPAGTKRIVTLHDLIPERMPHLGLGTEDLFRQKRSAVLNADGIICVSQRTRQDMLEFYGQPRGSIAVIYHANSLALPASEQPPVGFPYILFVGSRGGYKGFAELLEAFAASTSLQGRANLVCFGGGPFRPQELEHMERLGVSRRTYWMTGPDQLLSDLYAHARALVYPSHYEGFGLPLLEAMHYGCPVVASRASCLPEIAGDAALYFEPGSAEALTESLISVLGDPARRAQLVAAGRQREAQFSWERAAAQTASFYQEVNHR